MAIAPTGNIYKALEFDGESSRSYGVYITGEAVYNAPERDVEMISIAGRNGSYALDKGRFQNIEVTYPAGIFADNETDFRNAISDFRNFLCSKRGYVRLTDEYNPTEYRMAIYKSGLEVEPTMLQAGEFEITFECKPQRWLTSGETRVSLSDGDTITNPTLFDSHPMLEVEGYGSIGIGGDTITIENTEIGDVLLLSTDFSTGTKTFDASIFQPADEIYFSNSAKPSCALSPSTRSYSITSVALSNKTHMSANYVSSSSTIYMTISTGSPFAYGTAKTTTSSVDVDVTYKRNSTTYTNAFTISFTIAYDGDGTITITRSTTGINTSVLKFSSSYNTTEIRGYSTTVKAAQPLYIDLDIGEAYGEVSGVMTSMNNIISMPAELPVLTSGSNTITYDNTITDFKVVPRWWKV